MIDLALTWQIDHITQSSLQYFSFLNTYVFSCWLRRVFVAARWHSLGAVSGATLVAVCRLPTAAASLVAEHGLWALGSVVVVHRLSCSEAS